MLAEIGLDRRKVYITNVLNWRPPQNREPSPEEAASCLPFLHRHIELADPKLMILLGAVSVRHVLGLTEGITRVRGKWNLYQSVALDRVHSSNADPSSCLPVASAGGQAPRLA